MGQSISTVDELYVGEKAAWTKPAATERNLDDDVERPLLQSGTFRAFTTICLCYQHREAAGLPYDHYFVELQTEGGLRERLEFSGGGFTDAKVILHNRVPNDEIVVQMQKNVAQDERLRIQKRIIEVLGFRDYSLLLRNCEHVGNYVYDSRWYSEQVTQGHRSDRLIGVIVKKVTEAARKSINVFPDMVRLKDFEVDRLDWSLKEIYAAATRQQREENERESKSVSDIHAVIGNKKFSFTHDGTDSDGSKIKTTTKIILLLGPTGAGKSRLINVLFGKAVATSKISASSVTKEITFYYGHFNGENTRNIQFCIIDTAGFCDTNLSNEEIMRTTKYKLNNTIKYIDQVYFVFNHRLEKVHIETCSRYAEWLSLKPENVCFIITKCESLNESATQNMERSFKNDSFISRLFQEANITVFGSQERGTFSNLLTVGFPDKSENKPAVFDAMAPDIQQSYDKLVTAVKCDGVRPVCGSCRKRGDPQCVFLGSKSHVDHALAEKHQRQIDRWKRREAARRSYDALVSSALVATASAGPSVSRPTTHPTAVLGSSLLPVKLPDQSLVKAGAGVGDENTPEGLPPLLYKMTLGMSYYDVDEEPNASAAPSPLLPSSPALDIHRPGAPAVEEQSLIDAFFLIKSIPDLGSKRKLVGEYGGAATFSTVHSHSTVQPICKEELWLSLRESAAIEAASRPPHPDDNICTYLVQLCDLHGEICDVVRKNSSYLRHLRQIDRISPKDAGAAEAEPDTPSAGADDDDPVALERASVSAELDALDRLDRWYAGVPEPFRLRVDDDDWLFEVMNDWTSGRHRNVGLYAMYHGWRCLLLRRQCMLLLRAVAAEASKSSSVSSPFSMATGAASDPAPTSDDGAADSDPAAAVFADFRKVHEHSYGQAMDSARALSALFAALNRTNASLPILTTLFLYSAGLGALLLVLVHITGVYLSEVQPDVDATATAVAVGNEKSAPPSSPPTLPALDSAAAADGSSSRDDPRRGQLRQPAAPPPHRHFRDGLLPAGSPASSELAAWLDACRDVVRVMGAARKLDAPLLAVLDRARAADYAFLAALADDPVRTLAGAVVVAAASPQGADAAAAGSPASTSAAGSGSPAPSSRLASSSPLSSPSLLPPPPTPPAPSSPPRLAAAADRAPLVLAALRHWADPLRDLAAYLVAFAAALRLPPPPHRRRGGVARRSPASLRLLMTHGRRGIHAPQAAPAATAADPDAAELQMADDPADRDRDYPPRAAPAPLPLPPTPAPAPAARYFPPAASDDLDLDLGAMLRELGWHPLPPPPPVGQSSPLAAPPVTGAPAAAAAARGRPSSVVAAAAADDEDDAGPWYPDFSFA
ncbi:hypothetical protein HK405_002190 [Cladochytrium tenue]|nr:hypothetical protein HK405_002190 [Cladochytrium tenue]